MLQKHLRYHRGDTIGGRYRVHHALGGGMGEVYLCLDLEGNTPIALKTLRQRYLTNPQAWRLFETEVATWVALEKHPNIVRCRFMDIIERQPFMHLEWVAGEKGEGTDLRALLRNGPLALRLALDLTIDICRGLRHAARKRPGIVHRDLKPDNVLVSQDRLAKITDFGLATVAQFAAGEVAGTPPYMAPEQWRGEELDARTDLYAVGCILYELLAGRWPYQATSQVELRRQHETARIPTLPIGSSVPKGGQTVINGILARSLAKRREERWASVDELIAELTRVYQVAFGSEPRTVSESGDFTATDFSNRGATYRHAKQYELSLIDCNRAIELEPTLAFHYNNRGLTLDALGQYDRALADFDRVIALDPGLARAYIDRGLTYRHLRQYDKALADFSQAIELDSSLLSAFSNRGATYHNLEQYDQALLDYDHAIKLDPTLAEAYDNRGLTNQNLRQYDRALIDLDKAIELDPNLPKAYFHRGEIYRLKGQFGKALADYDETIARDSNYAPAYFSAGAVLANDDRLREALPYLERAGQLGDAQGAMAAEQVRQLLRDN